MFSGHLSKWLFVFCSICHPGFGQEDSLVLPSAFFNAVLQNHPLVKQANLNPDLAKQELLMNRGQFDPKLGFSLNRKSFEGKEYYNLYNPEIKIPTWPNIDLKAGLERNTGLAVNSEDKTPKNGLLYIGIQLPIAQGLLTDARRASINQAKIGLKMADAERIKLVNKILLSASKDFWDWIFTMEQLKAARFAFQLSEKRYRAVKDRVLVGDLAPIDTVEAHIFNQDREFFLSQSKIDELNSRLQVSTYLWGNNGEPLDLKASATPQIPSELIKPLSDSTLQQLFTLAKNQHPDIQKINLKLEQLHWDRKLSSEMLKPKLNLNYNWLSAADNPVWAITSFDRSYKFGIDFGMPLFLRKERGRLGLVKTKILQIQLDKNQIIRDIVFEIQSSFNDLKNLENLLKLQANMVSNYQKLREGEVKKFENGESSLFLINSREFKLIEAQVKQALLISKYQKEKAFLYWAAGQNPVSSI